MSVSFTPQPQALSAAIADRLRQEVLQGQWSPGETINDGMLAARYGVQRAGMLPHPARMCKHMRWGLMQRFPSSNSHTQQFSSSSAC